MSRPIAARPNHLAQPTLALLVALSLLSSERVRAQDASPARPYVFLLTAPEAGKGLRFATLEAAYIDRAFQPIGGGGVGQAVAVGASVTGSLAFFARAGTSSSAGATRTSAEAELYWTAHPFAGSRSYLTLGGGAVRSYDASNALRVRFGAGQATTQSRIDASVALERPLASDRDAVDVITMVGWMRNVAPRAQVGFEAVGQDLEGFWDADEAEGGARLYVGPSLGVSMGGWQVDATAGPVIRASRSNRESGVERPLSASGQTYGLGMRMAISRAW